MKKVTKIISVLLAVMVLSTSVVFGIDSKTTTVKYKGDNYGEYTGYVKTKKATMNRVKKSKRAKLTKKTIGATFKKSGITFTVNKIAKNAFKGCKKLKTIVFKGKVALTVAKGAFSGCKTSKMTFKVTKKMSKANFKKLKKNLKKAGFKGKIVRK